METRGINCKVQQNKLKSKSVASIKIKNTNKHKTFKTEFEINKKQNLYKEILTNKVNSNNFFFSAIFQCNFFIKLAK